MLAKNAECFAPPFFGIRLQQQLLDRCLLIYYSVHREMRDELVRELAGLQQDSYLAQENF